MYVGILYFYVCMHASMICTNVFMHVFTLKTGEEIIVDMEILQVNTYVCMCI